MGTKASIPKLLIIHPSIYPSIHPGGPSLFQWYNQRAQKQNWRRSGLQDLNPVFSRSQSTRVFFFSDKIFVMVFLTHPKQKKEENFGIFVVVVVVVVVGFYLFIYLFIFNLEIIFLYK
jgi:hypothetical protein